MGKKGGGDSSKAAAAADKETALQQTYADRANQYNPFGSLEWTTQRVYDPGTKKYVTKWTQQQKMSDALEGIYGGQMSRAQGLGDLSSGMMGRVAQEMGAAPDWGQFGDVEQMQYDPLQLRQQAEDAAYQKKPCG